MAHCSTRQQRHMRLVSGETSPLPAPSFAAEYHWRDVKWPDERASTGLSSPKPVEARQYQIVP